MLSYQLYRWGTKNVFYRAGHVPIIFPNSIKPIKLRGVENNVNQGFASQFGHGHGEAITAAHDQIPDSWKPFGILLPATVWEGRKGDTFMSMMFYSRRQQHWLVRCSAMAN